ncbi:MAG TPA: hypothetical protein VID29_10945 [Solirubrobacteraceae bacterium]
MPPEERFVPRFFAEPPREALPYGRWAQRLDQALGDALAELDDAPADLGRPGETVWYPDRGWHGRTYVPFTAPTDGGYELFGHVRFIAPGDAGEEPSDFYAEVDFTDQTARENPQWRIDVCDAVIGSWRGHGGALAAITLVWGRPLVASGAIVTAELAGLAVDQCELLEDRFTLIAPDDYRHDLLEIRLWDRGGRELAAESLYEGEDGEDEADADG